MDQTSLNSALQMVEKFSERELAGKALELDQYPAKGFSQELLDQASGIGLFSFLLPEDQGGIAGSPEQLALLLEVIAQREAGFAALVLAHSLACNFLAQAQREIPADKILSFPVYLDPENLEEHSLNSEKSSDGKIKVSGRLRNLIGGGIAESALVPVLEPEGISWFLLKLSQAGIRKENLPLTLGLRTALHTDLVLEKIELSESARIGKAGSGKEAVSSAYFRFYPAASAILIGLIAGSARSAIKYGLERYQGGEMIADYQQIRFYYGEMLAGYYSLKAGLEKICGDAPADQSSRIALKAMSGNIAVQAAMDGVQMLGGYGYMHDYGQEKRMRDAGQAEKLLGAGRRLTVSLADIFTKGLS